MSPGLHFSRTPPRPIIWGALCVALTAVLVQVTRSGVDILALVLAGFILLVLERTVGDWVAEVVGAGPVALLFGAIAVSGLAYVQTDGGRGRASRFFTMAEARGYRTAYFTPKDQRARSGTLHGPSGGLETVAAEQPSPSSTVSTDTPRQSRSSTAVPSPNGVGQRARSVRISRLEVLPDVALTDREITFNVDVTATEGVTPQVEFSVDGHVVGRASIVSGVASFRWKTSVPGRFVVRVRLADRQAVKSALLNVLPARSR